MTVEFERAAEATIELLEALNSWDNDPALVHLERPNRDQAALERRSEMDLETLAKRLDSHSSWLIRLDGRLVGEMNYMVDPSHLYRKVPGSAWIGIVIGEAEARHRGVGGLALGRLEEEIWKAGLARIELGVFEFNAPARRLYARLGYAEIATIKAFTWWEGRLWDDIRMEKARA